jgi:hypothetical protein
MFKVLVLQTLYTLSGDQTEYQCTDRLVHAVGRVERAPAVKIQFRDLFYWPGIGRETRTALGNSLGILVCTAHTTPRPTKPNPANNWNR